MPNIRRLLRLLLSCHTATSFMWRLQPLTFRLIIVVCDISKRIMRMKCDKNYFHVTPEHLTSDGLVRRSTGARTSGTGWRSGPCSKGLEALVLFNTDTFQNSEEYVSDSLPPKKHQTHSATRKRNVQ